MRRKRSKLRNKALRAVKTEREQEVYKALGKARADRDKANLDANNAYREGVLALEKTRAEDRRTANERYEKERTQILKQYAEREEAA